MLARVSEGRVTARVSGVHGAARFYDPRLTGVIDSAASAGSSIGVSTAGSALALSSLATAGIGAGVSLAVAGVQMWLSSINLSHQQDTATTQIVNGLEPLLRANVAAFQAGPQTQCSQQVALAAFDQAWQWLTSPSGCGSGSFGSAGNRCISDRSDGGRWPWHVYYRDPIAAATVVPNSACPGTTVSGSGLTTDVTNDLVSLLPGGNGNYFALLDASGNTAGVGSSPSSSSNPLASISSAAGGLSTEDLLLLAAAVVALVVVSQ